jgi:hypothetical protein
MMPKFDPADDVIDQEFDFISDAARKKMYAESCDVVDAEGTATEKRFTAALDLGARIQARRALSAKSLANIYRFEMDQVLKDYDFPKSDETPLKELMQRYWKHAPELREALGEVPPKPAIAASSLAGRDWVRAADGNDLDMQPECPHDDAPRYNFLREAGVR